MLVKKKFMEIKAEMQNFAYSAQITFKRLTLPVKHWQKNRHFQVYKICHH